MYETAHAEYRGRLNMGQRRNGKSIKSCIIFQILLAVVFVMMVFTVVKAEPEGDDIEDRTCTVTLLLDGGAINGLVAEGWVRSSTSDGTWNREVTEGTRIVLREPYRAGYEFDGWTADPAEAIEGDTVTATGDVTVKALWKEAEYEAVFVDNASDSELVWWKVSVPYGSVFWDEEEEPWTEEDVIWTPVTDGDETDTGDATEWTAEIDLGTEGTPDRVTVTRHWQDQSASGQKGWQEYYYTFRKDATFYFTYGGALPEKEGYRFREWSRAGSTVDSAITSDTVYTARYTADQLYVFSTYYYNDNGTRVESLTTQTQTKKMSEIIGETVKLEIRVPEVAHYTGILPEGKLPAGTRISGGPVTEDDGTLIYTVEVKIKEAFRGGNYHLAFYASYEPSKIDYTIEYYKQNVGEGTNKDPSAGDYTKAGTITGKSDYGLTVNVIDKPGAENGYQAETGQEEDFDGFLISDESDGAVRRGVKLDEQVTDPVNNTAVIRVYYDRSSYFIYPLTDSAESTIAPVKVQYGADIPKRDEIDSQVHKSGYRLTGWIWYVMDENGDLKEYTGIQNGTMPAFDLYPLAQWEEAETSVNIVYWVEDANGSSYLNEGNYQLENIPTGTNIIYNLGDQTLTATGSGGKENADLTARIRDAVRAGFHSQKGTEETYFTYDEDRTRRNVGNVQEAEETGTGNVEDGRITGNSYITIADGDGTATINVYYKRNLYTLEFVLARKSGNNTAVASNTNAGINTNSWENLADDVTAVFNSFSSTDIIERTVSETYGSVNVEKIYRIQEADQRDARSATGRYGTWESGGYVYPVYLLTARYGADISELWPTAVNIDKSGNQTSGYLYISMGSHPDSKYKNDHTGNPNILGIYSTMDEGIISMTDASQNLSATDDNDQKGAITHQLLAYWNQSTSANFRTYTYYYLEEVLDASAATQTVFDFDQADSYSEGQLVSYDGRVYEYTEETCTLQRSTASAANQNQPERQGFTIEGKSYVEGNTNIYFFYSRNRYNLRIFNVSGNYTPPRELTEQLFELTDGSETTLKQLGWEEVRDDTVIVRYDADLTPINDPAVITYITDKARGDHTLKHEQATGENQWYFSRWYRDQRNTTLVDWEANDIRSMAADQVIYTGWFTPRYTTGYALNGGSWADVGEIARTLLMARLPVSGTDDTLTTIYIYYDHMTQDETSTVYWYELVNAEDRLYVYQLYEARLGEVMEHSHSGADQHWHLRETIGSLEELKKLSKMSEDITGAERLVDVYMCYMQYTDGVSDAGLDHNHYVSINRYTGDVLERPEEPVRNGYEFAGWWHFDSEEDLTEEEKAEKIYLEDVLPERENINSFSEGYVWINAVQDAHLLHEDEDGLYYYPAQTGYRFSYDHNASVVDQDRILYAAWTATGDTGAKVMHLIPEESAEEAGITGFRKTQDGDLIGMDTLPQITINGTVYYILETETYAGLYTGSEQRYTSKTFYSDNNYTIWLPTISSLSLHISDLTAEAEVTEGAQDAGDIVTYTPNEESSEQTYRVKNTEGSSYSYYAWFVYEPTTEVRYTVYAIDIRQAVAEGVLTDYDDRLERVPSPDGNEPYVLEISDPVTVKKEDFANGIITIQAPDISGYVAYSEWEQEFQLEAGDTNNIYFYYINADDQIKYSITYYLMDGGTYTAANTIRLENIPGATGESLRMTDLTGAYETYVSTAWRVSSGEVQDNQALEDTYQRYKDMTIRVDADGVRGMFAVNRDSSAANTLDQETAAGMVKDYVVDNWSPTGETLILSEGVEIEVYLKDAQIILNKLDAAENPLQGAQFLIERFLPVPADATPPDTDIVIYDGVQYCKDTEFEGTGSRIAESDASGKAVFYDLSADTSAKCIYRVREVRAPAGQMPIAEPFFVSVPYITISEDGSLSEIYYTVTYDITNPGVIYLPKAGVFGGVYIPLLAGGGLVCMAVILYIQRGQNQKKKGKRNK